MKSESKSKSRKAARAWRQPRKRLAASREPHAASRVSEFGELLRGQPLDCGSPAAVLRRAQPPRASRIHRSMHFWLRVAWRARGSVALQSCALG